MRIDEILFFQSDEKYTRVVTARDEAHVRKPLKEIAEGLDPQEFWQVHRGVIVRASAIARAQRDELGRITLQLKNHGESLAVSQAYGWRRCEGGPPASAHRLSRHGAVVGSSGRERALGSRVHTSACR